MCHQAPPLLFPLTQMRLRVTTLLTKRPDLLRLTAFIPGSLPFRPQLRLLGSAPLL